MTAPSNFQSHNQPSPPFGWLALGDSPRRSSALQADWYKHLYDDAALRARHRRAVWRASDADFTWKRYREEQRLFDRFLVEQFAACEPRIPGFPLVEWLAVQIYWWYVPTCWVVDLTADNWLYQLREADERSSFSMAECRAHALKVGYQIPLLEEMMLHFITREPSHLLGGCDEE